MIDCLIPTLSSLHGHTALKSIFWETLFWTLFSGRQRRQYLTPTAWELTELRINSKKLEAEMGNEQEMDDEVDIAMNNEGDDWTILISALELILIFTLI